jgi:CO/xanthine dehydrogenase FAD-binding subunit
MATLQNYYQPDTLAGALELLSRTDLRLAPLGGGTQLIGALETGAVRNLDGVVDLRKLNLDAIRVEGGVLHIGATATLAAIAAHPVAGSLADGLLARAAQGEGPVNLRNMATAGGVVAAAEADSEFYAALLALDASVVLVAPGGTRTVALAELAHVDGLITEIQLPLAAQRGALARVARTPADRPIVAALAVRGEADVRVVLCGVAARPMPAGAPLNPPDDFKGSAAYRRAMAEVLAERVRATVGN